MDVNTITAFLNSHHQPAFRLDQLQQSVQKGISGFDQVLGWPQSLKELCLDQLHFTSWQDSAVITSIDGTKKAALTLRDGAVIETVLMAPKPNQYSVCVSSEVGCPMNCAFCATGALGLKRKLTAEEITDQYLFWHTYITQQKLPISIHSIVYMGMGEPLDNYQAVRQSIQIMREWYGIGSRHLSVSTCGIPSGIESLASDFPQVNLAISLHSAIDEVRSQLMPIAKVYSLQVLACCIKQYLSRYHRQLMFEYLLIEGVNDRRPDYQALIDWLGQFPLRLVHVNLIRYNQTYRGFQPTPKNRVEQWKYSLTNQGISVSIRKNLGADIAGACGQLTAQSSIL